MGSKFLHIFTFLLLKAKFSLRVFMNTLHEHSKPGVTKNEKKQTPGFENIGKCKKGNKELYLPDFRENLASFWKNVL